MLTFNHWGNVEMEIRLTFGSIKVNEEEEEARWKKSKDPGMNQRTPPPSCGDTLETFGCE